MNRKSEAACWRLCLRAPAATRSSSIVVVILISYREAQQRSPKLIGRRGQQPLGLDARLDGLVEPDEIERHVAHQRQVVGNVTDASACVVVTELDIQTPVQPILHFPMTSDRHRNALGVGRQAADVVRALRAGVPPTVRSRSTTAKLATSFQASAL